MENTDLNNSGISFLFTDLDVGLTFMDVAEVSEIEETRHRNHKNARTAYDAVFRLLKKLKPDAVQRQLIDEKLTVLKRRLEAVGQQF